MVVQVTKSELIAGGGASAFVGSPDMCSVCERLLKGVSQKYNTQVVGISRLAGSSGGWALSGPAQEDLGSFDWLCVTSHTMGHPRWEAVFGSKPPLMTLSASEGDDDAEIAGMVSPLRDVVSLPVMICMTAFRSGDPEAKGLSTLSHQKP